MSNINIKRAVENIRAKTTVYTPIVEIIVNAIEAIEDKNEADGQIDIIVERSRQNVVDTHKQPVEGITIKDNGIGFTDENRNSFDTLYSDHKLDQGGKGFGRFTCLKYFDDLEIESVYREGDIFRERNFVMGKGNDIIIDEEINDSNDTDSRTLVKLVNVKDGKFTDKTIEVIARELVERLLPYFVDQDYTCPSIGIAESDGSNRIVLNEFVNNQLSASIKEVALPDGTFSLIGNDENFEFVVRLFKIYSPKNQHSKVSLVAHRREVTNTAIHHFIPEFFDEFFDKEVDKEKETTRNYIVKAYVFGDYLDKNVSLERGGFEFQRENDLIYGISRSEIEKKAADLSKQAINEEITSRQEKKRTRIQEYVEKKAPWHKPAMATVDLSSMSYRPSDEEMETLLQKDKYRKEIEITNKIGKLLQEGGIDDLKENINELVSQISETSKNDLIHYVALRKKVLELFEKNLELDPAGNYSSEGVIHDIIFPRKKDSDAIPFYDHNLWIVDERLNFAEYVSSDKPLGQGKTDRPDLLAYDRRVLFRGDNQESNPVTIFEFKRPKRDDFVNPSSNENPIQQIVRYVNKVREGKCDTPKGRKILVSDNTPFYGYIVCDLSPKIEKWLQLEQDYKPMPDKRGWFRWHDNINLYLEVISWDKILSDAGMRNRIFFHKLGIN